ncbi:MAG: hypothetical protein Q8P41_25845 [Pseudomonadota bacterium]|nr:hypothetical protein [Pseudomonadota bacterium]
MRHRPSRLLPLVLLSIAAGSLACGSSPVDKAREALAAGQPDVAMSLLAQPLADDPGDAETLAALGDVYLMQARQSRSAGSDERPKELMVKAVDAWQGAAAVPDAPCVALERRVASARLKGTQDEARIDEAELLAIVEKCGNGDYLAPLLGALAAKDPERLKPTLAAWYEGDRATLPMYTSEPESGGGFTVTETRPILAAPAEEYGGEELLEAEVATGFVGVVHKRWSDGTFAFADTAHPTTTPETGWIDWSEKTCGKLVRDPRWWTESYACNTTGLGRSVRDKIVGAGLRKEDEVDGARCTGKVGKGRSVGFMNTARCEVTFTRVRSPYRSILSASAVFHPAAFNAREQGLRAAEKILSAPQVAELRAGKLAVGMPMAWVIGALAPTCPTGLDAVDGFRGEAVVRRCELDGGVVLTFADGVLESVTGITPAVAEAPAVATTGPTRTASPALPRSASWKMTDSARTIPALAAPAGAGVVAAVPIERGDAALTAPVRAAAAAAGFPALEAASAVAVDLDRDGTAEVFACGRGERGELCFVFHGPAAEAVEVTLYPSENQQSGAFDVGAGRYLLFAGGDGSWASVDAVRYDGTTFVASSEYVFQNDGY